MMVAKAALPHLLSLLLDWPVHIGTKSAPAWLSWARILVAGGPRFRAFSMLASGAAC